MDAKFEKQLNWGKIDTGLSVTISDATDSDQEVEVLISLTKKPAPISIRWLKKVGVVISSNLREGENVRAGRVTLDNIRQMTHKPYIAQVHQSRQNYPAGSHRIRAELVEKS